MRVEGGTGECGLLMMFLTSDFDKSAFALSTS